MSFLASFLILSVPCLNAAQFTADMLQTQDGKTSKSKLYVKNTQYRMDMQERETEFFVLVDRKEGITRVVFPADREFMDMRTTSKPSLMNNPFESFRRSARQYERKEKGKESFKGFECSKVLVRSGEQELFTAWISEELDFPLKIVFHLQKGMSVVLDNIQQGKVDESVFKVPESYTAMKRTSAGAAEQKKDQGPERESWMDRVSSAEVLEPPVKKGDMEEGEIFRVKIKPDKALSAFTSGGVRIYAFKQGQPVVKFVDSGGRLKVYLSPEEADEIVLYNPSDSRFRDHVRVKQGDMPERLLSDGEEMRIRMKPGDDAVARFVNMADSESKVYYTWLSQSQELPESELAPKRFRSKTLRAGKNFRSTYNQLEGEAPGDTLLVQVQKGRVLVKAGQPFQSKTVADAVQKPAEPKPETARTKEKSTSSVETAQRTKQDEDPAKAEPAETKTVRQSASPRANIMFILDASGSMWGEVEGRDKIAIAKEVMTELIQGLPEGSRVGLTAYGHRRKGDCSDVEALVPLGPMDKERLTEQVQAISPKGKTPITRSVRQTAETLRTVEDETVIVLVSDGKETCQGDPCAMVRELKEAGIRFTLHVIGFDVTEEERRQLECMASAGGGTYYTAQTAHEFRSAAREVVKAPPRKGTLRLTALRGEDPFRASMEIFPAGGDEPLMRGVTGTNPDRSGASLKPGTYDVRLWDDNLQSKPEVWLRDVTVKAGRTTDKEAVFDAPGVLELSATKGGEPFRAKVMVYPAGSDRRVVYSSLRGGTRQFELSAGTYDIVLVDKTVPGDPEIRLQDVQVAGGKTTRKEVVFEATSVLELSATKGGEPFRAKVMVYPAGSDRRVVYSSLRGGTRQFELSAGTYDARLLDKEAPEASEVWFRGVTLEPGKTVKKSAEFSP
jgi:Ca-activated chloride channel family protein